MSKKVISPVKRWGGSVTLADPLTLAQVELIESGLQQPDGLQGEIKPDKIIFHTTFDRQQLPAIFACVEKWELADFPENPTLETFPFTPRGDNHKLIEWLFGEIRDIYIGESEVPNE